MHMFNTHFQKQPEPVSQPITEEQSRVQLERQVHILAHALEAADELISEERHKRQQAEAQVQELLHSLHIVLSGNAQEAADHLISEERHKRQQAEAQVQGLLNAFHAVLHMRSEY